MIQRLDIRGTVQSVTIRTGDDVWPDTPRDEVEHMAYEIRVVTDAGTWAISGCHDFGPDVDPPCEIESEDPT